MPLNDREDSVDVERAFFHRDGRGGGKAPFELAMELAMELGMDSVEAGSAVITLGCQKSFLDEAVSVYRDAGGVHGRRGGGRAHVALHLAPGHPAVWDRRLELTAIEPGWTAQLAPDGRSTAPIYARAGGADAPGDAIAARWLVEARISRLLWRGAEPPFR